MKNVPIVSRIAACAAALLIVGSTTEALAGSKYNSSGQVTIRHFSDGSSSATGVLSMIYDGPGVNEYIGCQASSIGLFCHARDETTANHVTCTSKSTYLTQSVATIAPDTRLTFFLNARGVCTSVIVTHSSEFADKQG